MISRRGFVKSMGMGTVVPGLASALGTAPLQPEPPQSSRPQVTLNGTWQRHLLGSPYDVVQIPSSQRPLGYYQLKRDFVVPSLTSNQRAVLHFEAITYHGRVFVNDVEIGTMIPYVPHEFDVTRQLRPGNNNLVVAIADLTPAPDGAGKDEIEIGINPGWEAYGGIIRDVYLEIRPAAFVDNVRLTYELSADFSKATCKAKVFLSSSLPAECKLSVSLHGEKSEVVHAEKPVKLQSGSTVTELGFELTAPALWSPAQPSLYRLEVTLQSPMGKDTFNCSTGFRKLEVRGRCFYLNGARLQLHGLSWLGLWKDQGFTLSRQQMAQDMQGIKGMGANFVRLHLFPQDRYVVELADRLGLLVWEEPGYWQVDYKTMRRSMIDLGLRILEKTIQRDWNSPSVMAWILGNESNLTVEYLQEGKRLCTNLDPGRLVSFANYSPAEKSKLVFHQSGMDFYCAHPYTFKADDFDRECAGYGPDKPLVFDEWGGRAVVQSPIIMQAQSDRILELMEKDELAGEVFFDWNDWPEFSRIDTEMVNGICSAGVVTESREIRDEVYGAVAHLFQGRRHEELPATTRPTVVPLRWQPWSSKSHFRRIELQPLAEGAEQRKAWAALEGQLATFWDQAWLTRDQWKRTGHKLRLWQGAGLEIMQVGFRAPVVDEYVRPLVLTPEVPAIDIPLGLECANLHFLGQVTLPSGFPMVGSVGEVVASYTMHYGDGRTEEVRLRNGFEVAAANLVHVASRTNPDTVAAQRALVFTKDAVREQYQVLLLSLPTRGVKVDSITWRLSGGQLPLMLFALTAEVA
jgi:beta-glucuronidase